jgi:CAP12/Pycsar effector protein, TIR domain
MQHAFQVIERTPKAGLPILATANDVREVVQLLKKRPEGITIVEASDATKRRLFDPRKIAAYELWGIISKSGDRIKLSRLGREFAASLEPEVRLYRVLLDNTPAYRALLEWVHRQRLELVTHADIVGYWQSHFPEALHRDERTATGHVLSFLQLCHAAEVGVATAGRKGQPSRLRVDHAELAAHLRAPARRAPEEERPAAPRPAAVESPCPRVFVSAPKGASVISRIQDALQMADIASDVIERDVGSAELIPERTRRAMRRCGAGIIVVGRADYEAGAGAALKQSTLVEIGAACVQYARRLVLLRGPDVRLPFDLEGLRHYELEGYELTWETGLRLVRAVKQFCSELEEETDDPPESSSPEAPAQ